MRTGSPAAGEHGATGWGCGLHGASRQRRAMRLTCCRRHAATRQAPLRLAQSQPHQQTRPPTQGAQSVVQVIHKHRTDVRALLAGGRRRAVSCRPAAAVRRGRYLARCVPYCVRAGGGPVLLRRGPFGGAGVQHKMPGRDTLEARCVLLVVGGSFGALRASRSGLQAAQHRFGECLHKKQSQEHETAGSGANGSDAAAVISTGCTGHAVAPAASALPEAWLSWRGLGGLCQARGSAGAPAADRCHPGRATAMLPPPWTARSAAGRCARRGREAG